MLGIACISAAFIFVTLIHLLANPGVIAITGYTPHAFLLEPITGLFIILLGIVAGLCYFLRIFVLFFAFLILGFGALFFVYFSYVL